MIYCLIWVQRDLHNSNKKSWYFVVYYDHSRITRIEILGGVTKSNMTRIPRIKMLKLFSDPKKVIGA